MFKVAFFAVFALVATNVFAEGQPQTTIDDSVTQQNVGEVTGSFEMRPTWLTRTGEFESQNTIALGYKFSPDFELGAVQYFDNNISSRGEADTFTVQDAFVRAKFNNVWVAPESGWSFSYQPRFYLPTKQSRRDAGQVTTIRNYLNFTKKVSPTFSFTLTELPIFHIYNKAGTIGASGAAANPVFENRIYAIADWNLGSNLSFSLPLMFHQTRHADFVPGAKNNNDWSFFLYTWPELSYAVDQNFTVGLSYYTDNFVESDLSGLTINEAFQSGVAQLVLRASL